MKVCSKCGIEKDEGEFYKRRDGKQQYRSQCKQCARENNRVYHATDKGKEQQHKYYEAHKEKILKYNKKYYEREGVKDKIIKRASIFKKTEKGKATAKRGSKIYRQLPEVKEKSRLQSLERQYRKLTTSDGSITVESMRRLLVKQNNKCFHCGCDLDFETLRAVHLDHLQPVSKGGKHVLSNVVYSCAFCNMSKGSNY